MSERAAARIAFIGAGNHATQSLYPNIAHLPEFDLVAVCDLDAGRAEHAARRFGAPRVFTDVAALLGEVELDGACVCGPAEMHHQVGLQLLQRGLPVWMEKPPALDLAGARELVACAAEQGTWGMVGFMKRFAPASLVAKEYMASPEFGALSALTLIHSSGPYDDLRRMLLFNGIHFIDLGRYLAGEVEELFAYALERHPGAQAASVTFRFASGAVGQLNMNSGHAWSHCWDTVYVSGENCGVLLEGCRALEIMTPAGRFAEGAGLELYGWGRTYEVSGNLAGWASGGHYTRGYCGELAHYARALLGQVEPRATLADGAADMAIIEAILESAASGRPVSPARA